MLYILWPSPYPYVRLFYLALFHLYAFSPFLYDFGTLSFRFGRPSSSYLVCGFLTVFLVSGVICKHIAKNPTCSPKALFLILSFIGLRSSSQAFLLLATCPDTSLCLWYQNAHRPVLALLPHTKPCLTCYQERPRDLLDNEEQKTFITVWPWGWHPISVITFMRHL